MASLPMTMTIGAPPLDSGVIPAALKIPLQEPDFRRLASRGYQDIGKALPERFPSVGRLSS